VDPQGSHFVLLLVNPRKCTQWYSVTPRNYSAALVNPRTLFLFADRGFTLCPLISEPSQKFILVSEPSQSRTFSNLLEYSRTVENVLDQSRTFSNLLEYSRTVENVLDKSELTFDDYEYLKSWQMTFDMYSSQKLTRYKVHNWLLENLVCPKMRKQGPACRHLLTKMRKQAPACRHTNSQGW